MGSISFKRLGAPQPPQPVRAVRRTTLGPENGTLSLSPDKQSPEKDANHGDESSCDDTGLWLMTLEDLGQHRSLRAELMTFSKVSSAPDVPTCAKLPQPGKTPQTSWKLPAPDPRRNKADWRISTQVCRLRWPGVISDASYPLSVVFCGQWNRLVLTFAQCRHMLLSSALRSLSIFNAWRNVNSQHHCPLQVFCCDQ